MDITCADCGRATEVVRDHSTGDTVCSECGLVLESHSVDETSEWRTFANDDNNDTDPNRVGKALNPLLDTACLTTTIADPKGTKRGNMLGRSLRGGIDGGAMKSEKTLISAFAKLANMADRLGLVGTIIDRGCELYKKVFVDNNKTCRGSNLDAALGACLLVACQQEELPRTVKEICSVVGASKKDVMRAKSFIMKQLSDGDAAAGIGRTIRACDIVKRFCSNLGIMNIRVTKAAMEAATKCEEEIDIRRSPISVAAALIFVIVQLIDDDKVPQPSLKDIAAVTSVAEGTIKNTYKDLHPHVTKIVPTWYATQESIHKMLCCP